MIEFNANLDEKTKYQATLFSNRLQKNLKSLKKWARKNRISCYRIYDKDIPEIPVAVDLYTFLPDDIQNKIDAAKYINNLNEAISLNDKNAYSLIEQENKRTYALLYLYERPYEKDEKEEEIWLNAMAISLSNVLGIPFENVVLKTRRKQSGDETASRNQYEKIQNEKTISGLVQEQGEIFKVNLTDYIDTGLFFDHRPLRKAVRESCSGKTVLNLFCYTGSFSVYAAEGKAKRVHSVDLSNTYLDWARENMQQNDFYDDEKYIFTRQDCTGFLNQANAEVPNENLTNRFDIIILDPPTFSNSKKTQGTLDINRDWIDLVKKCLNILNPKGTLYFSTNSRRLVFDESLFNSDNLFSVQDITSQTIPEDYRNSKIHRGWKITKNN